ncbi:MULTISPECIES: MbcA/ParS/Xre antitoxin family protein [Vibrio]|nr:MULTISPECIES: MbcA/ParS/Xre antitoxin family protein [Vibrio]
MRAEWLTSAIPALSGLTPLEVVLKGDLKRVLDALNRIKYGDFS